jgi:tetratricopeptide (TPR) repeat protein
MRFPFPLPPGFRLTFPQALLILVLGFWTYWPALHGGWLWDDDRLITDNFQLRSLDGLWKTWFVPGSQIDYYPLEQTVLWIEWQLWQNQTLGYHLVNVILHIVGALLVWRLFDKLGLRFAWLGGLLFALHPVQVESVAWIAELKNALSLPPLLLAMCAWIDYDRLGDRKHYLTALALFLVALLCKLTVVMFPVVVLLYAWWKRTRIGATDLKRSAPFFLLALAVGLITILSGIWDRHWNHLGAGYAPTGGAIARLVLVGQETAFYFSKSVLPVGLLPTYPKWPVDIASPVQYLPWIVLIGVIAWLWTQRRGWGRHVLFGLGFFLINLAPCPGFIPGPDMGYAWVMDHFLYLPIIGLIGLFVAACGEIDAKIPASFRLIGIGAISILLVLLAWESRGYAGNYLNQETLWSYTLRHNPDSDTAHNNLGLAYLNTGRLALAEDQFNAALLLNPNHAFAHNGLGNVLFLTGHPDDAMLHYRAALRINPDYAEAHNGLANALLQANRLPEAKAECEQALQLKPHYVEAHCNLGLIYAQQGQSPEAIAQFETAQTLSPSDPRIQTILAQLRATPQASPEQK